MAVLAAGGPVLPAAEPGVSSPPAMFMGKLSVVRLEDDLHAVLNGGGNSTAIHSADAVFIVDSGIPQRGKDILAAVTALSPAAIHKTLFNTHWHFDHVGGNGGFAAAGYAIVGSTQCRQRMGQTINFEDLGMQMPPSPEEQRPAVTFDEKLDVYTPSRVRLVKFAPAHTDTDAAAIVDAHGVLITGDLVFNGTFPVIDRSTGGSLDGMIAASAKLLTIADAKTRVIPGHGPLGGPEIIQAQLDLLKTVHDRLAPLGEKKTPLAEVLEKKPLADLDDKYGRGFLRSELFTKMAYGQWLTR
jgi:glyoxylase-like metal-dependent hydrolase (beta-lactamase superfamily II)